MRPIYGLNVRFANSWKDLWFSSKEERDKFKKELLSNTKKDMVDGYNIHTMSIVIDSLIKDVKVDLKFLKQEQKLLKNKKFNTTDLESVARMYNNNLLIINPLDNKYNIRQEIISSGLWSKHQIGNIITPEFQVSESLIVSDELECYDSAEEASFIIDK